VYTSRVTTATKRNPRAFPTTFPTKSISSLCRKRRRLVVVSVPPSLS
jgi:hypothetical protein